VTATGILEAAKGFGRSQRHATFRHRFTSRQTRRIVQMAESGTEAWG
jgi:hypothetical protein